MSIYFSFPGMCNGMLMTLQMFAQGILNAIQWNHLEEKLTRQKREAIKMFIVSMLQIKLKSHLLYFYYSVSV